MTKTRKTQILLAALPAAALGVSFPASAMHIMEGALPAGFCVAWGLICLPFLLAGFFSIQKTIRENRRAITLLAMSGAFIFVISSLKIPSVSGSCSHMTGTGLGAVLFGPSAMSVLGILSGFRINRKVSLFAAAFLGDLFTYCVTAFQLALAHNSATSFSIAFRENLVIFAGTQIPLAVVEGLLTVAIVIGLESYAQPELAAVGFLKEGTE